MSEKTCTLVWLRHDLRLSDNPALYHAAYNKTPIIPVFIYDPDAMDRDYGAAQKWWLHHALHSLRDNFKKHGVDLLVRQGNSGDILNDLISETGATSVTWNRSYEKWSIDRDSEIKEGLKDRGIEAESYQANVLFEPWTIKNGSGTHYKVFTPYYKKCMEGGANIDDPLPTPNSMVNASHSLNIGEISDFNFLPDIRWDQKMADHWDISEDGAWDRMRVFFKNGLDDYKDGRDCPSIDKTSKLSPYLRWGMISPRSIWHETNLYVEAHDASETQKKEYLREVIWREFTHHLLYYYPDMRSKPLQDKFEYFPWKNYDRYLTQWQKGETGYPIVDAGMRQLWQTGWVHNRVRMIVGSLLVKHLLQPWQHGEDWFWDCLVDADPANNTAGWQWIGGCGADASPYFRIFNPITQGDKFNAHDYVREFVPELKNIPDKYLFNPWEAPAGDLKMAGVELGKTYPEPLVTHKEGRERAMDAFQEMKENAA